MIGYKEKRTSLQYNNVVRQYADNKSIHGTGECPPVISAVGQDERRRLYEKVLVEK